MKNQKNCFPYGYVDRIREDEVRLSDYVVITAKNNKVQEYTIYYGVSCGAICFRFICWTC